MQKSDSTSQNKALTLSTQIDTDQHFGVTRRSINLIYKKKPLLHLTLYRVYWKQDTFSPTYIMKLLVSETKPHNIKINTINWLIPNVNNLYIGKFMQCHLYHTLKSYTVSKNKAEQSDNLTISVQI